MLRAMMQMQMQQMMGQDEAEGGDDANGDDDDHSFMPAQQQYMQYSPEEAAQLSAILRQMSGQGREPNRSGGPAIEVVDATEEDEAAAQSPRTGPGTASEI